MSSAPGSSETGASIPPVADPHETFARSLVGSLVAGRYVVERVLGKGGMGLVVSARYAELEQQVAIKVMFPEHAANPTLAKRFVREAKVAAKLRSPNLVRVTDIGNLESGVPYLVMELLSGHDLDRELAERGPLPIEDAVEYVLQAATGLAELHAQGIVHRDLKPGNLFLAEGASGPEVKILDYGISKDPASASTNLTVTDALMGTPSHMSPEQIKTPKEVDARSDIWSLGVILYELLAYKLPYDLEGSTVGELFGLVLFSDPVSLRKRRPELPEALEEVVMRCLRRDREERWPTIAALAEALEPFARPESKFRVAAIAKALARPQSNPAIPVRSPEIHEKATVVAGAVRARSGDEGERVVTPVDAIPVRSADDLTGRTAVAPRAEPATDSLDATAAEEPALDEGVAASSRGKSSRLVAVAAAGLVAVAAFVGLRGSSAPATNEIASGIVATPMAASSDPPLPEGAGEIHGENTRDETPDETREPPPLASEAPAPAEPVTAPAASATASARARPTTPLATPSSRKPPPGGIVRAFPGDPPPAGSSTARSGTELILDRK